MFKRIATLLLGLALVGLGVLLFAAPEQNAVVQWLTRYWPLFLTLAGLVRLTGYLIDRHPRSPVGALLIAALGGVLLAANLRGERSLAGVLGNYWFWLLLAFIAGRVLLQYLHRFQDGKRPQAFSPGAICAMLLLVGGGLGAKLLAGNSSLLSRFNLQVGRIGDVRDYVLGNQIAIADEPAQTFTLPPNARLVLSNTTGDIEVRATAVAQPSARLIKRIRAVDEAQAREAAKNITLQITPQGNGRQCTVNAAEAGREFSTTMIIELPPDAVTHIEVANALGSVKLTDLRGDHQLANCDQITVGHNAGRVAIDNPRGAVTLSEIQGDVGLLNTRRDVSLREIKGNVALDAQGGTHRLAEIVGLVNVRLSNGRLEVRDVKPPRVLGSGEHLVALRNVASSTIHFQEIDGSVSVEAVRSKIDAEEIKGNFIVGTSGERVRALRVAGKLEINAEHGTVEIEELTGGGKIEASGNILVRNFHGPLDVRTRAGTITLATNSALGGDLRAAGESGRIKLTLPEDIGFQLDALTGSGRLRVSGFDGLSVARNQRTITAPYNVSGSAPLVNLRLSSGDIQLLASGQALAGRDEDEDETPTPKPVRHANTPKQVNQ